MKKNCDFEQLIEILESIKENILENSNFLWTPYDNATELNSDINLLIFKLQQKDASAIDNAYSLFLPTATFQEHSMMNSWVEKYMKLAQQVDEIYDRNKN